MKESSGLRDSVLVSQAVNARSSNSPSCGTLNTISRCVDINN